MSKYRKLYGALILVCVLFVFICGHTRLAGAQKLSLKIGGGPMGSTMYLLAARIADIINKNVPEVMASAVTGSSKDNCPRVNQGIMQAGYTLGKSAYDAYNGIETFQRKHDKLRLWFSHVGSFHQIIARADSDIHSMEDLKGKRIHIGPKGVTSVQAILEILSYHGITEDSMKESGGLLTHMSWSDAARALQDKTLDAGHFPGPPPYRVVMPLEVTVGVRIIPYSEEAIELVKKEFPGCTTEIIPKGAYKAVDKEIEVLCIKNMEIINADIPEDVVYNMTKAVYENVELLHLNPVFARMITLENALSPAVIPVHPGAMKYYKEHGVEPSK